MHWCEDNGVDHVFGLARNDRVRRRIAKAMRQAIAETKRTGRRHGTSSSLHIGRARVCQFVHL